MLRIVFLLLLATTPDKPVRYAVVGPETTHVERVIRHAWQDGWWHLCRLVGSETPAPEMVRVDDPSRATMIVDTNPYNSTLDAECRPGAFLGTGKIVVFYGSFSRHSRRVRGHVICHELLHFYYGLPDQYYPHRDVRPDCVMGNYLDFGWSGKLCESCRGRVAATRP